MTEESQVSTNEPVQNVDMNVDIPNNGFNVPHATETPTQTQEVTLDQIIPEEYKDKAYLSKYKDIDSLFKGIDSMQSMIGKRQSGIPQENASQEEWDNFYTELGRPKTAEEYNINIENDKLPEGITIDDKVRDSFKAKAYEIGLTEKQAQQLLEFDINRQNELLQSQDAQLQQLDIEFDTLASKHFGEDRDKILKTGNSLLTKYTPDFLKEHLSNLDNNSLLVMSGVLNNIAKDYISEDNISSNQPIQESLEESRSEVQKLMTTEAFTNPFHADHDRVKQQIRNFYSNNFK